MACANGDAPLIKKGSNIVSVDTFNREADDANAILFRSEDIDAGYLCP